MIRSSAIALNAATPTLLVDARNVSTGNPKTVVIQNNDASITIYIGGETRLGAGNDLVGGNAYTLSSANGVKLVAGASITLTLGPRDSVYGIAASGTPSATVFETGTN